MIIECPDCESKVDAKILAEHVIPPTDYYDSYKYLFLVCPLCNSAIVAGSDLVQIDFNEYDWATPERRWPNPNRQFEFNVPTLVTQSLIEAEKCYKVKAYSACAVMCGRTIEAICVEESGEKSLFKGLQELKKKKIIDEMIYDWGETLRKERNIGAHASTEKISKKDANDILDFTNAIVEYIYTLSEKYREFQKRKTNKKK